MQYHDLGNVQAAVFFWPRTTVFWEVYNFSKNPYSRFYFYCKLKFSGPLQEKILEIEYIKAVAPRKEEEPSFHDDWVSAVDGSDPRWAREYVTLWWVVQQSFNNVVLVLFSNHDLPSSSVIQELHFLICVILLLLL